MISRQVPHFTLTLARAGEGGKQALREDSACLARLWPQLRFPVEFKAVTWAYRSPGLDLRTGQVPPGPAPSMASSPKTGLDLPLRNAHC